MFQTKKKNYIYDLYHKILLTTIIDEFIQFCKIVKVDINASEDSVDRIFAKYSPCEYTIHNARFCDRVENRWVVSAGRWVGIYR